MVIEVKDLEFGYKKPLFKNLNFNIRRGQIVSLLGLNGAGKSTLLFVMMGILKPKFGSVKLYKSFSFVSQNFNLGFDYCVLDVMLMARAKNIGIFSSPCKKDISICENKLEILNILNLKDQSFLSLSGGQKQLVLIARALAQESEIIFLDEPTSALDLKNQNRVLKLIKNLNQTFGLTVVFTTHDPNQALALSDKTLILDDKFKFGPSKEILTKDNLKNLYQIPITRLEVEYNSKKIPHLAPIFEI